MNPDNQIVGGEIKSETPRPIADAIVENKTIRRDIDPILQQLKDSPRKSRERSLAITKLQEAIMWLGMDLKELGAPNPYPNSRNPDNLIVDKPPMDLNCNRYVISASRP